MSNFIEFLYSKFLLGDGVSIDTRTLQEDNLFFAVSGPNFNANTFAKEALEKGASYAIVDEEKFVTDDRTILVDDCLTALQDLATFHRSRFKRPVLAITGSNGKTTTRELIARALSEKYIVHATSGNFNNHIGVPLTLLHILPQTEIAIIEMGANHVGEIARLCSFAQPTHGLITNIGHAHTEGFGGFEGVIRGKSELFDYLKKTNGQAIINLNDPVLNNMSKRFNSPVIYPFDDLKLLSASPYIKIELEDQMVTTALIGFYNFENIAASIAVGKTFNIPNENLLQAVASYRPENARSQVIKNGDVTIILDAYNANPNSMKAALENLAGQQGERIAILGDMNELEHPDEEHRKILDLAGQLSLDKVITIGQKIGKVHRSDLHCESKDELVRYLKGQNFSGSTVLLKASRSIQLESVVDNIKP